MTAAEDFADDLRRLTRSRRRRAALIFLALIVCLAGWTIFAIGYGPLFIAPHRVVEILVSAVQGRGDVHARDALVVLDIRLPRALLAVMVGASLAVSGALMQSLFRNPLADPGIVGVSAGAGLAAAATIALGDRLAGIAHLPFAVLPPAAFGGSLASTLALYLIATRDRRTSVARLLLAGVALAALAGAVTGFLVYVADDAQLRDLMFWSLGSLGGATWAKTAALAPVFLLTLAAMPFLSRGLDALAVGEAEAFHLGVAVQRLKTAIILLVALATGTAVAAAGIIGFVGLVVPHILRLGLGPDHARLLPASVLLGGALLLAADTCARLAVAPAELPIGILTAAIGAPVFLWLLLRGTAGFDA